MKKGKWSKKEDDLIKNHIEKYGIGCSWQSLSNALGLQRCGRSCRSRWLNYLRPGLKHGNFTPAEDRVIYQMYSKKGSSWSAIAAHLPGRTDLAVKNYWNSTLKKRFPPAVRCAAARRRHHPIASASTSSDDDDAATPPDLALVVYSEGSTAATGSSSAHGGADELPPCSGSPPAPEVQQPEPAAIACAVEEEPIAAVPVSGPVGIEQSPAADSLPPAKTPSPPPPSDHSGEVDVGIPSCFPYSPLPFIEPDLPELDCMTDFDDIAAIDAAAAACYPKRLLPMLPDSPGLPKLPSIADFEDVENFLNCVLG